MNAPAKRISRAEPGSRPASSLGAVHEVWLSSGTACLIAALEAIEVRGRWVALPPNVCPNVVAAVYAAGGQPWFVDVEPARQGMDPVRLSEVISEVAAVIAVHAYGVPCRVDEIMAVANAARVPVIEDCAQADGAEFAGKPVGDYGDIGVFSFGTGKIVDAGGGGLATTRSERWHAALLEKVRLWPQAEQPLAGEELAGAYKDLYNRFYPDRTSVCQSAFMALLRALAPALPGRVSGPRIAALRDAREKCRPTQVSARRRKYAAYRARLEGHPEVESADPPAGAAPWRFNALLPEARRNRVFRMLLAEGFNVSTWYPDISRFLLPEAYRAGALPLAGIYDRRVINLWLDDSTGEGEIERVAGRLASLTA